jgi:hypothetical protein
MVTAGVYFYVKPSTCLFNSQNFPICTMLPEKHESHLEKVKTLFEMIS